jgi:hypothetical protein
MTNMFSKVKYDGEKYFVADQVYVKFDVDGNIEDIIIIENKLKDSTPLTDNQKGAKLKSSYTVRNTNPRVSEFQSGRSLTNQSQTLNFDRQIKWYKVWDHDNGDVINDMKKI